MAKIYEMYKLNRDAQISACWEILRSTPIRALKRLYKTYTELGDAEGRQKKTGTAVTDNFSYEMHWYENNGQVPDAEIKIQTA